MNTSFSDYSSGCESGWTMYLDQNSTSTVPYSRGFYDKAAYTYAVHEEDDEEDLSMVSDASSGPPHSRRSQYYGYASEDKTKTKTKSKAKSSSRKEPRQQNLCLDDTASSSILHFSQPQDNVPCSNDHNSVGNVYSAAHYEGESISKKRLGFLKSSTKGKSGSLLGRKKQ